MKIKHLRGYIWFLAIALFIILELSAVKADFYTITHRCENNQCVQDRPVEWDITIYNQGEKKIEIISIELRDSINNTQIANYSIIYRPLTDQRGDIFVILPFQRRTKTLSAKLPKANNDSKLLYYPCFVNAVREPYIVKDEIYSVEHCYSDRTEVIPILECASNYSCANNEYCLDNKCIKLKCEECQYISSHRCISYECCNSGACSEDEECRKHKCIELNCGEDEYSFNHSCLALNCSNDDAIINHSCVRLDCAEDEFIFNSSCVRLDCAEDEFIFNHSCVRLNCTVDEFISNNSCIKLDCMFNEAAVNHSCMPLKCHFFQRILNHQCKYNKPLIFKSGIEVIVILIIVSLLFIDLKRYKSKQEGPKEKE